MMGLIMRFKGWDKVKIKTLAGEFEGISPIVISASRSTDIPAFHSQWFLNRLNAGYVKWINPFNRLAPQYISFEKVRVIVFWTKNPAPLIPYLKKIDEKGIHYYFQYTLNDYDKEGFEPNVPKLQNRIATFKKLSNTIGKNKVVWRFDPLILYADKNVSDLITKIENLGRELVDYTNKLVFSFIDVLEYKKVQNNLTKECEKFFNKDNVLKAEFTKEQKEEFASGIQRILIEWKKRNPLFTVATCAEDIDLKKFDIEHNKCIDDNLMIGLFNDDKALMNFLGYTDCKKDLFGMRPILKDTGQRKACDCIFSKDIGSYNTCNHLCIYCYANTSRRIVESNLNAINNNTESLLPANDN